MRNKMAGRWMDDGWKDWMVGGWMMNGWMVGSR